MATDERIAPEVSGIERQILAYLRRELLGPNARVGRDTQLLSGEVLDSMSVLRLAAFVAEEFQIVIPPADFTVENFQSVAAIAGFIRRAAASRVPELP